MDKPPEQKKKLSKKEAVMQLVQEDRFSAFQKLFTELERKEPHLVDVYRSYYEEFMKVEMEAAKQDPKGEYATFEDMERRNPGNAWVTYMKARMNLFPPLSDKDRKQMQREFKRDVKKRMKGEDIH